MNKSTASTLKTAFTAVAAKQDVRYYLQGLNVYNNTLEATDGHTLLRVKLTTNVTVNNEQLILDQPSIKTFFDSFTAKKEAHTIAIKAHQGAYALSINNKLTSVLNAIIAKYPDCSRVINSQEEIAKSTFSVNLEYLKKLAPLEKLFNKIEMVHSGDSLVIHFKDSKEASVQEAVAVIMERRL